MGVTRIQLQVNKHNHKAIHAYHRNGFVNRKSIVVEIGDGYFMDDFLMEKTISGS